jgi:hypothetical protein
MLILDIMYVLECVANDFVLTKARIHDDRIKEAGAAEGSERGRPLAGADADTCDPTEFSLRRVEDILAASPGAGDSDELDDIGPCDARGAAACSAPRGSAAAGDYFANPFYFAVPVTSAAASSSSAPALVKLPVHHLVLWHSRLVGFCGPTLRCALPAAPTHTQHAENMFGHLKHHWLDHRQLPVGLHEYLKAVLGGGDDDTSISAASEARFRATMATALPRQTRRRVEAEEPWGAPGTTVPYKEDTKCGAKQQNGQLCGNQGNVNCVGGKCGKHCPDATQCTPHRKK